MNVDEMMLSTLTVSRDKQHPKLGGCVGVFFQLFDWNRRLSSRKFFTQKQLLPAGKPPRIGSSKVRKFQEEYRKPKLLLISDGRECKDTKEESVNGENYQERINFVNVDNNWKTETNSFDNDINENPKAETTTTRRNPGVVARLMGLETLPISCQIEKTEELSQDASSSRFKTPEVLKSNHLTSFEEDDAFLQEIITKCHDELECRSTACFTGDGYGDNDTPPSLPALNICKSDGVGSNLINSAMTNRRSRVPKAMPGGRGSLLTSDISSANASTDVGLSSNSDGAASSGITNHHHELHSSSKHSKKGKSVSSYSRRNKISKSSDGNGEIVSPKFSDIDKEKVNSKSSVMFTPNVGSKKVDMSKNDANDNHIKLRFQCADDVDDYGFDFDHRNYLRVLDDGMQDEYYQRRKKVDHRAVERNGEFSRDQLRYFSDHESMIRRSSREVEPPSVSGSGSSWSRSKDSSNVRKRNKSRLSKQRSKSMDSDEIRKHLQGLLNSDDDCDAECANSMSSDLINCRNKTNNDEDQNIKLSDMISNSDYGCLSETVSNRVMEASRRRRTEQLKSSLTLSSSKKELSTPAGKEEVSLMKALMKRRAARLQQAAMEAEKQLSAEQSKIQEPDEDQQTLTRREKLSAGRSELAGSEMKLLDLDQLLVSTGRKSVKLDGIQTAPLGSPSDVRQAGSSPSNNSVCSGISSTSSASGGVSCRTTASILQELMSALGAAEPPAAVTEAGASGRRRRRWSGAVSIDASDAGDGDGCCTPPASICTAETESTSESVSCCGGTGQPSPVSVLVSPFDDDTSTPCEPDTWRIRTEEDYVAAVLAATWDEQAAATRQQRSSPAWAFEALEERVATGPSTDLPTTRSGRRLVFDCVQEALEEDRCRYAVGRGCTVVRLVHERIRGWRPPPVQDGAPLFLEDIVAADLKRASNSWTGPFHTETTHIVSALERSLFRSLIHDLVSEFTL